MDGPRLNRFSKLDIKRIVLIYVVFAGLWIVLSDQALEWLIADSSTRQIAQTFMGWFYVAITSLLLYFLLKRSVDGNDRSSEPDRYPGLINWKPWQQYLFAATVTLATLLLRESIIISFGERPLLILFMFPVILSAAIGGFGPGMVSTLLAVLSVTFIAFPAAHGFRLEHSYDLLQLGFLVANGLLVSILSLMLHEARHKSDQERKKALTNLDEKSRALQLLHALTEGSTDAIFAKDIEGRYLLFNQAAARFVGKSAQVVLGKGDAEIFPPNQAALIQRNDREVIQDDRVTTFQENLDTKDGKSFFLATKGPLHDGAGKVTGVFGIARDITEIKSTEFALRRERDLSQRYLDSAQSIMIALDDAGRITMISRYGCELLGYRENELLGENWFKTCLPQPEGINTILPIFRRILAGDLEEHQHLENAVLCRDGRQRMISWRNNYFRNEAGNIVGTLSSGEDITERRQAEVALRESEETYRSLFEHMLNGIAYCRMLYVNNRPDDFVYLSVNAAFASQTGLKDVVGRRVSEVIPGIREADPELFEKYGRVASGGKPEQFEVFIHALDMWFAVSIYSPKPEHFVAVFDVVTERKKAEAQRDLFSDALRQSAHPLLLTDSGFNITYVNPAFSSLFGFLLNDLVGKHVSCIVPATDEYKSERNAIERLLRESGNWSGEVYRLTSDGSLIPAAATIASIRGEGGKCTGYVASYLDQRPLREKELTLRKLSLAVEQSPESIVITDLNGSIEYVNESFVRNTGYRRDEAIGRNPRILHSGKTPRTTYEDLWKNLLDGNTWQGELCNKRKDGSEYTEHAIISPIRQPDGRITHYVAVKEDITERMRAEAEIDRLAFYDTLTGLPNRSLLLERIAQTLALTRRLGHHSAMISFNIDRFKTINDAGGQTLGDALLKAVSERLMAGLREGDVVARISGDEFGILLTDLSPQNHNAAHLALHISEKIHSGLQEPLHIGNEHLTLTACLGIALFPENDEDQPLDILRRANTALHHAKTRGRGQTAFFEGALDEIAKQRFDIERELHQAITADELRVFLQPQVDAAGSIVGAEALVRWQHPQRGLVPPGVFIPIAEESNLIVEIGNWVFAKVCSLLAREDMVALPIRIAVNISPRHFRQADFIEQIKRGLASTGADPTHLTLEVSEGLVIDNINDVIAKMTELSEMGIHFSMDDFGTGYSSLSYLKRLPIHELKIDKSFIQDLTIDPEDDALVEAILAVAKLMHLKVVAEGVETVEQAAFLNQRAQVIHQGYLFGKPELAETVIANITGKNI